MELIFGDIKKGFKCGEKQYKKNVEDIKIIYIMYHNKIFSKLNLWILFNIFYIIINWKKIKWGKYKSTIKIFYDWIIFGYEY